MLLIRGERGGRDERRLGKHNANNIDYSDCYLGGDNSFLLVVEMTDDDRAVAKAVGFNLDESRWYHNSMEWRLWNHAVSLAKQLSADRSLIEQFLGTISELRGKLVEARRERDKAIVHRLYFSELAEKQHKEDVMYRERAEVERDELVTAMLDAKEQLAEAKRELQRASELSNRDEERCIALEADRDESAIQNEIGLLKNKILSLRQSLEDIRRLARRG